MNNSDVLFLVQPNSSLCVVSVSSERSVYVSEAQSEFCGLIWTLVWVCEGGQWVCAES